MYATHQKRLSFVSCRFQINCTSASEKFVFADNAWFILYNVKTWRHCRCGLSVPVLSVVVYHVVLFYMSHFLMNRTKDLKLILLNKTLSDRNCFSGANCSKEQGEKHLLRYHLHSVSYSTVLISVAKLHNGLKKVRNQCDMESSCSLLLWTAGDKVDW